MEKDFDEISDEDQFLSDIEDLHLDED